MAHGNRRKRVFLNVVLAALGVVALLAVFPVAPADAQNAPSISGTDQEVYVPYLSQGLTVFGSGLSTATSVTINGTNQPFQVNIDASLTVEVDTADTATDAQIVVTTPAGSDSFTVSGTLPRGKTYVAVTSYIEQTNVVTSWTMSCGRSLTGTAYPDSTLTRIVDTYQSDCRLTANQADRGGGITRVGLTEVQGVPADTSRVADFDANGPTHLAVSFRAADDNAMWVGVAGWSGDPTTLGLAVTVSCPGFVDSEQFTPGTFNTRFVIPAGQQCAAVLTGAGNRLVTTTLEPGDGNPTQFDEGTSVTFNGRPLIRFTLGIGVSWSAGLPVGVPDEGVGPRASAGAVSVFPISYDGTFDEGSAQLIHQGRDGLFGLPEADDRFGADLVQADFNYDGWPDLAIGVPGEDLGAIVDAGMVQILYGGVNGYGDRGSMFIHQNSPGVPGGAEATDEFGAAVAALDYNKDGFMDLAVGVPGEALGNLDDAGAVHIFYGSLDGIQLGGSDLLTQFAPNTFGTPEVGDRFGEALDGYREFLLVGSPGEDIGSIVDAGMVHVLDGLTGQGAPAWQGQNGSEQAEAGDRYGEVVYMGVSHIAIGVPREDRAGRTDAGWVDLLDYGSGFVASFDGFDQSRLTLRGFVEAGDRFGQSVAITTFPSNEFLLIGAPGENGNSGILHLYSISNGQEWNVWQQLDITGEATENGDQFGAGVAWSFAGGLVAGSPGEDLGSGSLLHSYNGQDWVRLDQNNPTAPGAAEAGDGLGHVLY